MEIVITVNGQSTTLRSNHCNCQSLIGRKYIPVDNSYSNCLSVASYNSSGKKEHYLAGNQCGDCPQLCTIVSEPFQMLVQRWGKPGIQTMILIKCPQGLTHCYMYYKQGLR